MRVRASAHNSINVSPHLCFFPCCCCCCCCCCCIPPAAAAAAAAGVSVFFRKRQRIRKGAKCLKLAVEISQQQHIQPSSNCGDKEKGARCMQAAETVPSTRKRRDPTAVARIKHYLRRHRIQHLKRQQQQQQQQQTRNVQQKETWRHSTSPTRTSIIQVYTQQQLPLPTSASSCPEKGDTRGDSSSFITTRRH